MREAFNTPFARRGNIVSGNSRIAHQSAFQLAGSGPGALGGLPAARRAGPGRDRNLAGLPSYHEHAWVVLDGSGPISVTRFLGAP